MDHQPGKEEADQDGGTELKGILKLLGHLEERQEEEKAPHQQGRSMHVIDRRGHEEKVDDRHPGGDRVPVPLGGDCDRSGFERRELPPEDEEVEAVAEDDAHDGDPAEMGQHMKGVPPPGGGHHEHRRGREVGKSPPHRDVDEEEPQGGVGETGGWREEIETPPQEQRRDGHGRWLGDE